MRGGKRPGAGRRGVNGWKPVCATLPRELYEALEKAREPRETLADVVRRCVAFCLITNDCGGVFHPEPPPQEAHGPRERGGRATRFQSTDAAQSRKSTGRRTTP